jgi:hypothetical protein
MVVLRHLTTVTEETHKNVWNVGNSRDCSETSTSTDITWSILQNGFCQYSVSQQGQQMSAVKRTRGNYASAGVTVCTRFDKTNIPAQQVPDFKNFPQKRSHCVI